jgi:hypothetical protein
MEFLVIDFPLSSSPASVAVAVGMLVLLVAGIPYLGALSDRMRTQSRRQEPVRKAA